MERKKNFEHELHVGTSGWSYSHWKEIFYPHDLKQSDWLEFYAGIFSTVEINTTFYHTPRLSTVENWYNQVPNNFLFAIKINGYITHRKRLKDCKESLYFFYRSIKKLKAKAGPILIQLPPSFKENKERLIEFIYDLDDHYRYTFEFRHDSWFDDAVYQILSDHKMALCITDLNGKQSPEIITADFTYIRLHGPKKAYSGS